MEEQLSSSPKEDPRTRPACVPRRFGIGTLMVITFACALFCGTLRAFHCPASVIAVLGGFLAIVGIAQAVLFGGKQPRKASMIAGAVAGALYPFSILVYVLIYSPGSFGWQHTVAFFLFPVVLWGFFGFFLGYLAGGIVAGIFWIMEYVRGERPWG